MTYQQLENLSEISLRSVLQYPSIATPMFWPIILFTIFMVMTLTTFFRELKREGRANFLSSLAVGSYFTLAVSVAFTLLGLVTYEIVVIILVFTVIFQVIYLLSNKN